MEISIFIYCQNQKLKMNFENIKTCKQKKGFVSELHTNSIFARPTCVQWKENLPRMLSHRRFSANIFDNPAAHRQG